MRKPPCWECNRKREAFRPVFKTCAGIIVYVCHACWRDLDYKSFMKSPMSDEDRAAMKKVA